MKIFTIVLTIIFTIFLIPHQCFCEKSFPRDTKIKIVADDLINSRNLIPDKNFSCVITHNFHNILFNTSLKTFTLLHNMRKMYIEPKNISSVFISHANGDFNSSLNDFLYRNRYINCWLPVNYHQHIKNIVRKHDGEITDIDYPQMISSGVYSSGLTEIDQGEQSLIVKTAYGMIIVCGCAENGIISLLKHIQTYHKDRILLLVGGFHLHDKSKKQIYRIIKELKKFNILNIAPSSCTGLKARNYIKEEFGKRFIYSAAGKTIYLSDLLKK